MVHELCAGVRALVHVDQVRRVKLVGSVRTARNVSQEDSCVASGSKSDIVMVQLSVSTFKWIPILYFFNYQALFFCNWSRYTVKLRYA